MFSVCQVMVLVCLLFISQTFFPVSLEAQTLEDQREALNLIISTVKEICAPVPLGGSSIKFELTGEGKADLKELFGKLANLGIEGATEYQNEQYRGVLQQDLASVLISNTACKSEIFSTLQKKIIPNISAPNINDSPIHQNSSQSFQYSIMVKNRTTAEAIFNAKVTINLFGYAPINVFTDANGFARVFFSTQDIGNQSSLTVKADGYQIYVQNIDLNTRISPYVVQLEPE